MKALRVAIRGNLRKYKHQGLLKIVIDMGKRQNKENLRSQEIITLDSIGHSDFFCID